MYGPDYEKEYRHECKINRSLQYGITVAIIVACFFYAKWVDVKDRLEYFKMSPADRSLFDAIQEDKSESSR